MLVFVSVFRLYFDLCLYGFLKVMYAVPQQQTSDHQIFAVVVLNFSH